VLFTKDKLYLIDFLDNFLETPLQDMVKLRQDTRYLWSLNMYPGSFDAGHMRIVLSYFDRKLSAAFGRHAFYRKFYGVFQVLNFVRILPYLKPAMRPYMSAALSSLAKETRP
jgi:hypothetical protein